MVRLLFSSVQYSSHFQTHIRISEYVIPVANVALVNCFAAIGKLLLRTDLYPRFLDLGIVFCSARALFPRTAGVVSLLAVHPVMLQRYAFVCAPTSRLALCLRSGRGLQAVCAAPWLLALALGSAILMHKINFRFPLPRGSHLTRFSSDHYSSLANARRQCAVRLLPALPASTELHH